MLNLTGMVRAPRLIWLVEMHRKQTLSEFQNNRKKRVYPRALTAEEAMAEAERQNPEFLAVSARRST